MVRAHETCAATGSVVLVSQSDLFGAIVLLGENGDPVAVDAVRREDILLVGGNVGPFWAIAFDLGGGAEIEDGFYA